MNFFKYYTNPNVAKELIELIDLQKFKTVIEPSAGNGSFSKLIPNCIAIDIEPEDSSIEKMDFFQSDFSNCDKPILTIGNPPFGNSNSLALKFFKKSSLYSDVVAFILPKSFRKISILNKIPPFFHLIKDITLEKNSFILNGNTHDVGCIFQIWEKRNEIRKKIKISTKYFEFVDFDNCEVIVRRVGMKSGSIREKNNFIPTSNYFYIKLNKNYINEIEFKKNINLIKWDYNSATCRSISKYELITEFEKIIKSK